MANIPNLRGNFPNTPFLPAPCTIIFVSGKYSVFSIILESHFNLCSKGQNGADSHSGTIRVHCALSCAIFTKVIDIREGGGTNQLFSLFQFCVKQSIASVPGHHVLELKREQWVL